ncbi:Basement membrane-specific heparan sulfate proteoglycan core protein-like 5, partial [Homarus americanus]
MCSPPESFRCNNGYCIRADQHCDGTTDCQDASDEKNCPPLCTNNDFRCDDGTCIPLEDRCNGLQDCLDHSDEANCMAIVVLLCPHNYLHFDLSILDI